MSIDTPPILEHAPEPAQRTAAIALCRTLRDLAGPHRSQADYAAERADWIASAEISAPDAIAWAIALLDYCLLDEMRPDDYNAAKVRRDYAWRESGSLYLRFFVYSSWFPPDVAEIIVRKIGRPFAHLLAGVPAHVESRFDGKGQIGLLTPELAYWIDGNHSKPPIGVTRQTLFASLLRCGFNPLGALRPDDINRDRTISELREPRRMRRNKRLIPIRIAAGDERLAAYEAKTAAWWGDLLGRPEETAAPTAAVLTASGCAANDAAIEALSELPGLEAAVHPYWYFENKHAVERSFAGRLDDDTRRAAAVFAALEPVTHSTLDTPGVPEPEALIRSLAERARANADRSFALVLDVTQDPLFSIRRVLGGAPPRNLALIKTVSVTKHQRGGRSYFFGAASVVNDLVGPRGAVSDRVLELRAAHGGALTGDHRVHFPRPSERLLRRTREEVAALSRAIARRVEVEPPWRFVPLTWHCFLLPPPAMREELEWRLGVIGRQLDKALARKLRLKVGYLLGSSLIPDGSHERYPEIESGNSFGLDTTRVLAEGWRPESGSVTGLSLGSVRISPGFDTVEDRLVEYTQQMVPRFQRAVAEALALVGKHSARAVFNFSDIEEPPVENG